MAGGSEEDALREMRELLKLRHYSPRTEKTYAEWVKRFFRYAKIQKLDWVSPNTVRAYLSHLATHLLMQGVNIREVQELLGHKSVETTMIYTHVVLISRVTRPILS